MPLTLKRAGEFIKRETLSGDELRVVTAFEEHIVLMLKDDWYISLDFTKVEGECMATEAFPEYRKATIEVDIPGLTEQWEYLNHYVRHELLHIIVWNFFDIAGTLAYKNVDRALVKLEESVIFLLEHMPLWEKLYAAENKTKKGQT
jgi:hypothetical protein